MLEGGGRDCTDRAPNMTPATIEQIIYHGFATHVHLRLPNGEPLIAFQQNRDDIGRPDLQQGSQVLARWTAESARAVREEYE